MHGKTQSVLSILAAPCRETSLKAISLALLRVRANNEGATWDSIATALDCSPDTVKAARDEKSLLSFDSIARLGYFFPDEFTVVKALWENNPGEPPTIPKRLDTIQAEIDAIRRESAQ